MEFSSSRIYRHTAQDIFDIMADFEGLAGTFPQVSSYDKIDDQRVRITINLDFGKFSGSYFADFMIHELERPTSIRIDGNHKSGIGGMQLNMKALIEQIDSTANRLTVSGTFQRSGLVSWASKSIIKSGMDFALGYMHDLVAERLERKATFALSMEEE